MRGLFWEAGRHCAVCLVGTGGAHCSECTQIVSESRADEKKRCGAKQQRQFSSAPTQENTKKDEISFIVFLFVSSLFFCLGARPRFDCRQLDFFASRRYVYMREYSSFIVRVWRGPSNQWRSCAHAQTDSPCGPSVELIAGAVRLIAACVSGSLFQYNSHHPTRIRACISRRMPITHSFTQRGPVRTQFTNIQS